MLNEKNEVRSDESEIEVKVPVQFTVKEVLVVAGFLISVLTAWGAFQAKIAILDQAGVIRDRDIQRLELRVEKLEQENDNLRRDLERHSHPRTR